MRVLKRCVPAAVAGIAFLSGGQSDEQATANLNAMNQHVQGQPAVAADVLLRPRAAAPSLKAWKGAAANVAQAQALLAHRSRMNGLAAKGEYRAELEKKAA